MLRVKPELLPFGNEAVARTVSTLVIINTGNHPDRSKCGNYGAQIDGHGKPIIKDYRRDNDA